MTKAVLVCHNIAKHYRQGHQVIDVLRGIDFHVLQGQRIAIVGSSGSGKSTLLNILGGLDQPDAGEVILLDQRFSDCADNQRGKLRNQHLGFVYQFHHLLPEFNAVENVAMPLLIGGASKKSAYQHALELLVQVGLEHRAKHKPSALSGGERQRVAIARALANQPACVLMDEPTGNLDGKNAEAIQSLMRNLSEELDTSFIVVTHDEQLASTMDSVYELVDGQLNLQGSSR